MQLTFTFKQSTTTKILPILESDNIQSMSPESSQPKFRRPNWSYSGRLAGSGQKGQILAGWPELARKTGSGQSIPARTARQIWPKNPGQIPAVLARIQSTHIPTKLSGFRPLSRILAIVA
jgi:hypothetical protein